MKDTKTILIVEDEEKLRTTVADFLKLYNYNVLEAKDGQKAIEMFEENMKDIDLVLLDIMLPVFDGQYVLKKIRDFSEVPIIMMTAKTGDYEQIKSFGNGVDDYIKKPFKLVLLKARIEAVLKRAGAGEHRIEELVAGDIKLDCSARKLYKRDEYIITTPKEYEVLCLLLKNSGTVLSRTQLLNQVWGYEFDGESRTVDVHIRTLRQKLGSAGELVETVRGVGYKINMK